VRSEMASPRGEMTSLDKRVDQGFAAVRAEIRAVNDRIDALKDRVEQSDKRLDEALNIRERLAAIEVKLAARG